MPEKAASIKWMCSKIKKIRLVTADLRALSSPEPECECKALFLLQTVLLVTEH